MAARLAEILAKPLLLCVLGRYKRTAFFQGFLAHGLLTSIEFSDCYSLGQLCFRCLFVQRRCIVLTVVGASRSRSSSRHRKSRAPQTLPCAGGPTRGAQDPALACEQEGHWVGLIDHIRCRQGEGEVLQCCNACGNYLNEVSIHPKSRTSADAAGMKTASVGVGKPRHRHWHRRKARAAFADTPDFLPCKLWSRTLAHCLPSPNAPLLSAASYPFASVDTFPPALPWPAPYEAPTNTF